MGYLTGSLSGLSKGTISFWFRISQSALDDATAEESAAEDADSPTNLLQGIVPLITWGPNLTQTYYQAHDSDADGIYTIDSSNALAMSPSFIGIMCERGYNPHLAARLQMSDGGFPFTDNVPAEEINNLVGPDFFQIGGVQWGSASGGGTRTDIRVSAGPWHHVLVSFAVSGSTCLFYWAFDDVNRKGNYLYPRNSGDTNTIVSNYDVAGFGGSGVISATPLCIPCGDGNLHFNRGGVQLGCLQIFTDITLDTSVVANRRLFVGANRRPADPDVAATALGKTPDVRFIEVSDWVAGTNTGSAGALARSGTITAVGLSPRLGA